MIYKNAAICRRVGKLLQSITDDHGERFEIFAKADLHFFEKDRCAVLSWERPDRWLEFSVAEGFYVYKRTWFCGGKLRDEVGTMSSPERAKGLWVWLEGG
jgi:hypothetical protein